MKDIVDAICASLISPPKYCFDRSVKSSDSESSSHKTVATIITVLLMSLMFTVCCAICLYKRFIRSELTRDMTSQVGEVIANYANRVTTQKKKKKEKLIETFE